MGWKEMKKTGGRKQMDWELETIVTIKYPKWCQV